MSIGEAAIVSDLNWRSIDLQTMRWVPTFLTRLQDPFITMRYHFDVHKLFVSTVAQSIEDNSPQTKRGSLRRALSKVSGVSSSSTSVASPRKERPGDLIDPHARIEVAVSNTISAEVERIIRELSRTVDAFVQIAATVGDVRASEMRQCIEIIAPYALVDFTITQHPRIQQLRLADNRVYIEIGRSQLRSHIYAVTAAHGYGVEQAEKRLERAITTAGDWLQEIAGDKARDVLPVAWDLHSTSHEVLPDSDRDRRTLRLMNEVPLIMIGTFHLMALPLQRDNVLESLLKFTF